MVKVHKPYNSQGPPLSCDSPIGEKKSRILVTIAAAPVFTFSMPSFDSVRGFSEKGTFNGQQPPMFKAQ